jgi:hypothetical protein
MAGNVSILLEARTLARCGYNGFPRVAAVRQNAGELRPQARTLARCGYEGFPRVAAVRQNAGELRRKPALWRDAATKIFLA